LTFNELVNRIEKTEPLSQKIVHHEWTDKGLGIYAITHTKTIRHTIDI